LGKRKSGGGILTTLSSILSHQGRGGEIDVEEKDAGMGISSEGRALPLV
jgi:hypothetical protein